MHKSAEGQGDKQAIANAGQTSQSGDSSQGDPQITVNADRSNECGLEQNRAVEQSAEISDFNTNTWAE